MKNHKLTIALTATLCCLMCLLDGCTRDNDIDIPQTSVDTMEATTVQPGEAITLTGKNMHLISKVYFGNETTIDIKTPQADRDHQSLTVYVPTEAFEDTQVVSLSVLYNSVHRLVVCEELTVYIAPIIPTTSTTLSGEAIPGEIITINGTDLNIIKGILANGEALTIDSKNATEITFRVPEVDADTEYSISLVYDNSLGNDQQLVIPGKIFVKETIPEGETKDDCLEVEPGKDITIEGTHLNAVKAVRLTSSDGTSSDIAVASSTTAILTFKAPEVEEDTAFTITLIYGKSDKETAPVGTVTVKKPTVVLSYYYWKDVTLGAPATECALFDASTGRTITPCDLFEHQNDVDFGMDATTTAAARLLNPANINDNFMKAQQCGETSLAADGKDYSTVRSLATKFKVLSTGNNSENTLIQKVLNGEITDLKEDIGNINPTANTPTMTQDAIIVFKNTVKNKMGIVRVKSVTISDEKKELNTVLMDVYYEK